MRAFSLPALATIPALLLAATAGAAEARETIKQVHIVSAVGDGLATDLPKYARADENVILFAVVETRSPHGPRFYSNTSSLELDGREIEAAPLADIGSPLVLWLRVEPAVESMSNTASGRFRFEPIQYRETVMPISPFQGSAAADVHPTVTTDRGHGVGTMRYKLLVVTAQGTLTTPGSEARRGGGSGGLSDRVHRVSIRRDDSYLGFLSEMHGQPYIWASGGSNPRTHQSERLEGADCADFVVYGRRRQGHAIPYTWTGELPKYTRLLRKGTADSRGVYRDDNGDAIPFPERGDLVLFPRHVGVLVSDRGQIGVLDHEDVMIHHYFASPREQAIGDSDYAGAAIETRRWK